MNSPDYSEVMITTIMLPCVLVCDNSFSYILIFVAREAQVKEDDTQTKKLPSFLVELAPKRRME